MFNPTHDFFERLRRTLIPKLGAVVHLADEMTHSDLYVEGETHHSQFVGRVAMSEEEFEDILTGLNFVRNPLAAFKRRAGTREHEEGSFRWLGTNHADYRDDFQLHVILYDGSVVPNADTDETYVYAHWEYRWDVAPLKHYRAVEFQPQKGVAMMQTMLDAHDIPYDQTRPTTE